MKSVSRYPCSFKTRFGIFQLWATSQGLYSLEFGRLGRRKESRLVPHRIRKLLKRGARETRSYLSGKKPAFDSLPVDWTGYGSFERRVLKALRKIQWGRTSTYKHLAVRAGKPRTLRYVGRILHLNRLPLILPCHRIVPKAGGLGGFSKGLGWKRRLLKLEGARVDIKLR